MEQLVGRHCIFCGERIPWELDARFCATCGSPAHTACSRQALAARAADACPGCGAPPAVVDARAHERRVREDMAQAQAGLTSVARGAALLVGGMMATVMCSGLALGAGTGRVVLATGAVGVGLGLVIRGLRQSRPR